MKLACLVILVIALRASAGPIREDIPHTFCGRQLANARLLYCFGATENMRKRSNLMTSLLPSESICVAILWKLLGNFPGKLNNKKRKPTSMN